jgi:hypothetical protein
MTKLDKLENYAWLVLYANAIKETLSMGNFCKTVADSLEAIRNLEDTDTNKSLYRYAIYTYNTELKTTDWHLVATLNTPSNDNEVFMGYLYAYDWAEDEEDDNRTTKAVNEIITRELHRIFNNIERCIFNNIER